MISGKKRVFVRYRNRKLHEIGNAVPYTTMEELAAIVREGHEIQVMDDRTNDDLTVPTLARLVYDLCRENKEACSPGDLAKILLSSDVEKEAA